MKINRAYVSFTGHISVGHYAFFINIGNGFDENISDLAEKANNFNTIVLTGDPFGQNEDVVKLIKKIRKQVPETKFIIETTTRSTSPKGMGGLDNIEYNINIPLKTEAGTIEDRGNLKAIRWFIDANAKFYLLCKNENDIEEIILLSSSLAIPRRMIFVSIENPQNLNKLLILCLKNKLNISIDLRKYLWNDLGGGI